MNIRGETKNSQEILKIFFLWEIYPGVADLIDTLKGYLSPINSLPE